MSSACALCARPVAPRTDDGPDDPDGARRSAICARCRAAGRPTRNGLEQAVLITARQSLEGAEGLSAGSASPEELAHHLASVTHSLRTLLQLFENENENEGEGAGDAL